MVVVLVDDVGVGVVSCASLGFVLLNIEGGGVFFVLLSRKSVRVYSFTGRDSSTKWAICLSLAG